MTNLREKKKEYTRKKIQSVSLQLFKIQGYEKTTMEMIAAGADIGLGTLYNYYSSKAALFFSNIESNIETFISEFEQIINNETTLTESLREFFDVYLKSFNIYGKIVWRDLLREIMFSEQRIGYEKIKEIDQNFIHQLYKLLCKRMAGIEINNEENFLTASKVLYSLLEYHIIYFVSNSFVTPEEMIESLMEQTNLFVNGFISLEQNINNLN